MKHVVNWTIGSFFRTIGRIIAYLIVGALIAFAFSYKPKAATLTTYDSYQLYWNGQSGCGSSNKYSYTTYANSDPAGDLWQQGSIGTRVYDKAAEIAFNFQYNLVANKYYDVDINLMSSDLSNSLNTTNVYIDSGTSCQDFSGSRVALIGFSLNNSGTNYSNKATIRIMANSATTYWGIRLYKGPSQFIAGPNNFGISSITINEVDPSNTNIIIDNATNNTTNIINNNNDNTQQIINNQNELLGNKCSNLYNGNITSTNQSLGTFEPNTTYYFSFAESTSGYNIRAGQGGTLLAYCTTNTCQFTTDSTGNVFFNGWGFTPPLTKVMLSKSTSVYCEYGSSSSKIDDITDSINDDNVSGATNKASNFFSNFTTNTHGLTSIITAPLSAIQSLTSATCSPLVLPLPFVNSNLTLPCMRPIYVDNFGGFMTLYDTITLGIVSYWILVRIFALVKDFKNPEHDEVEVMEL